MKYALIFLAVFAFQFEAISQNIDNIKCPCCTDKHMEFDFWLGNWEVTQNGQLAGTNTISKEQDNCVIEEKWISANQGFKGTSYNYYDHKTGQWNQIWIDNQGTNLHLKGNLKNGKMEMSDRFLQSDTINVITWTPMQDGSVSQEWVQTTDRGKNWTTVFDGLYRRRH
jgi:hypothetical protein